MLQPAIPKEGISSLTQTQIPAKMVITYNEHICYISLYISLLSFISELTRITRSQTSKKSDTNEEDTSPDIKPKNKKPKQKLDLEKSDISVRKSLRKRKQ